MPRASKLDAFKGQIVRWLDVHPYSAQQVFQRLAEAGYAGGITIVKDYVHRIRPRRRPAFLKLDFEPGECAQVDWGSYGTVNVGNTSRRLSFFLMVLCYSRRMYLEFTVSQETRVLPGLSRERLRRLRRRAHAADGRQPEVRRAQASGRRRARLQPEVPGLLAPLGLRDQPLQRGLGLGEGAGRKRRGLRQEELPGRPGVHRLLGGAARRAAVGRHGGRRARAWRHAAPARGHVRTRARPPQAAQPRRVRPRTRAHRQRQQTVPGCARLQHLLPFPRATWASV